MVFRDNEAYEVVSTADGIPQHRGPPLSWAFAGSLYPNGIPIYPESRAAHADPHSGRRPVVFAYSDIQHQYVMSKAATVACTGADFGSPFPRTPWLRQRRPWLPSAQCAPAAANPGRPATSRGFCRKWARRSLPSATRCPTATYRKRRVQRFASYSDLDLHETTIEELEEYEPHIDRGIVVCGRRLRSDPAPGGAGG